LFFRKLSAALVSLLVSHHLTVPILPMVRVVIVFFFSFGLLLSFTLTLVAIYYNYFTFDSAHFSFQSIGKKFPEDYYFFALILPFILAERG
jgi:hypothetical protein